MNSQTSQIFQDPDDFATSSSPMESRGGEFEEGGMFLNGSPSPIVFERAPPVPLYSNPNPAPARHGRPGFLSAMGLSSEPAEPEPAEDNKEWPIIKATSKLYKRNVESVGDTDHPPIILSANRKQRRSFVWQHFGFPVKPQEPEDDATADQEPDMSRTICHFCYVTMPYHSTTSNMATHLRRHHPEAVFSSDNTFIGDKPAKTDTFFLPEDQKKGSRQRTHHTKERPEDIPVSTKKKKTRRNSSCRVSSHDSTDVSFGVGDSKVAGSEEQTVNQQYEPDRGYPDHNNGLPILAPRHRKQRSHVWRYFGFLPKLKSSGSSPDTVDNMERDTSRTVCRLCYITIPYQSNTSNMASHLKRYHPELQTSPDSLPDARSAMPAPTQLKRCTSNSSNNSEVNEALPEIGEEDVHSEERFEEMDITFLGSIDERPVSREGAKADLTTAIGYFLSSSMIDSSIVDDPGFQYMIQCADPQYVLPPQSLFSEVILAQQYAETRREVQESLKEAMHVSLTVDKWMNRSSERWYFTVTAHYIDTAWHEKTFVLTTVPLETASGNDNGDGSDHIIQTILSRDSYLTDADHERDSDQRSGLLDMWGITGKVIAITMNCQTATFNANLHIGQLPDSTDQVFSLPSFACEFERVMDLGMKSIKKCIDRLERILDTLRKAATSVEAAATSQSSLGQPRAVPSMISLKNWGTAYNTVSWMLANHKAVNATLCDPFNPLLQAEEALESEEIMVLQQLTDFLESLCGIRLLLSDEVPAQPTLSCVLPYWQSIKNVTGPNYDDHPTVQTLKATIRDNFLRSDTEEGKKWYTVITRLACALDPRFKSLPFLSSQDRNETYEQLIKHHTNHETAIPLFKVNAEENDRGVIMSTGNDSLTAESNSSLTSALQSILGPLFDSDDSDSKLTRPSADNDRSTRSMDRRHLKQEVTCYRACPSPPLGACPLEWWKNHKWEFPLLSTLSRRYLCVQAGTREASVDGRSDWSLVAEKAAMLDPIELDQRVFLTKNVAVPRVRECFTA